MKVKVLKFTNFTEIGIFHRRRPIARKMSRLWNRELRWSLKIHNNSLMFIADNWSEKACRRRTQGVGRMRYMKKVFRRFRYAEVCV